MKKCRPIRGRFGLTDPYATRPTRTHHRRYSRFMLLRLSQFAAMAQAGFPHAHPASQACENCQSTQVRPATLTWMAVYFRCEQCGSVWAIRERRKVTRAHDARGF
jgi:hypothetical protein